MVRRPLFVARREPPELFQPIDQPLHPVAFAVDRPVERPPAALVRLARNRDPDPAPPQGGPDLAAAVALVTDDPLRAQPRPSTPRPFDRPVLQQLLEGRRLVALTGREHKGDRLAVALGAELDLGAEAALAPSERLGLWVPFFAPAACWWARMTVAST
jgi:hypothetical protein